MSFITVTVLEISSITVPATLAATASLSSSSRDTSATPVGISECVQRCVLNVAAGGPYGTCTGQLEDLGCVCNDARFQAATSGCIPNVCPLFTSKASAFANEMCADVITNPAHSHATESSRSFHTSKSKSAGLSPAAVAGVGVGSAIGGMALLAVAIAIIATIFRRRRPPNPPPKYPTEFRGYQIRAKEAPAAPVSPRSPNTRTFRNMSSSTAASSTPFDAGSPIDTVLSRDEQDELHALQERMKCMRRDLRLLEERERVELDGGISGLKELPG